MADVKPIIGSGKRLKGSKSPGIGYLYVLFLMVLAIIAGTVLSGGFVPVDPNGPDGPPTLEPYFNQADYGEQKIIMPSGALTPGSKTNLQLKTFTVNTCGQKTAVDFLIDTSASMTDDGKMDKAKQALRTFTKSLNAKSVIGIQTFSSQVGEQVPLSYYKDVKPQVQETIDNLKPEGWTRTRDGFQLAKEKLLQAISSDKYPGYKYSLILLTDGVPEVPQYSDQPPRDCVVKFPDPLWGSDGRCFAREQDPTVPYNIATDIKNMGVDVYSIAIFSQTAQSDTNMKPYLQALLKNVASQPINTHYYESLNADNLNKILDSVINKICEEQVN